MNDMLTITLVRPGEFEVSRQNIPAPGPGEVLVRVAHIGMCGSDATIFRGLHPYAISPLIMGHEFSGAVAALGEGVGEFDIGQRVAVIPHLICGKCDMCAREKFNFCESLRCTGAEAHGAHREYISMPRAMVIPIPDEMSLEDAALMEPACVAYHAAKRPDVRPEDIALVVGAGPIGAFCAQSVKALGAQKVFVADMDKSRLELAASLGADGTICVRDETLEAGLTRLCGSPKNVGLFYDCVGEKGFVFNQILSFARRGSRVVAVGVLQNGYDIPLLPDFVQHELTLYGTTMYVPQDYRDMISLMAAGKISTRGMVTHRFPLSEVPQVFDRFVVRRAEPFFKIVFDV